MRSVYIYRTNYDYFTGLSAAAILARDAMGDTKGDGLPKRDYGSFDSLQSGTDLV